MSLNPQQYTKEYFSNYEAKGRFLKFARGQRWHQFSYWLRYVSKYYPKGSRVLEVGCGLGYFANAISRQFEFVGIDIALFPLQAARSKGRTLSLAQSNAATLPFHADSFDVVVAFDILEHVNAPIHIIADIFRVLSKNGRIIVTTPNIKSLGNRVKSASSKLVPAMHTDPTHVGLLSPEKWTDMFIESGFEIEKIGSDTLWDIPYSTKIPLTFQKLILIPFNLFVSYFFGSLPWTLGENLVIVCKKH